MAARKVGQFLSPAHFEVIPSKSGSTFKPGGENKKLLTPREYEKVAFSGKASKELGDVKKKLGVSESELESSRREVDCLRYEVKVLKGMLEKNAIQQKEKSHRNKDLVRRAQFAGEASEMRKIAELEENNLALQSEARKQQAVISKLRSDIKGIKLHYEREIEKLDEEITKYSPLIRQLKKEIKEKDAKYENDVENLQEQLKNQASEIKDLTSELQKAHERIENNREGFENVLSQHEAQKYQDIKSLRESMKNCKVKYSRHVEELTECIVEKEKIIGLLRTDLTNKEKEIAAVKDRAQKKEKEVLEKMSLHKAEIQASQDQLEATGQELRHVLQETMKSHEKTLEEFREKLHQKDQQIKHEQNTIEQLRVYIGENLPNTQLERLRNKNEEMKGKMQTLIKENETINSTIEFLKIRLNSLNEILTIQENELNKTMGNGENRVDSLLSRWRHKVFALLVQLKSQEISLENDKNTNKHLISRLQNELGDTRKDLNIISHTLADRNAELQLERNTTKSLQQELIEKTADEKSLASSLKNQQDAMLNLYECSSNMAPFLENLSNNMSDAFARLGALSQRVSFAAGRVQFLQGLFAHKEAKWKNELKNVLEEQEKRMDVQATENKEETSLSPEQLLNEIKRLTLERDMLTTQAVKDADLLECRVTNIRTEHEDKLQESSMKIEQLQCDLKEEREHCKSLAEKLEAMQTDLQESNETVDSLKMDLAKHQSEAERMLDKVLADEQAKFTEEFAKLEKRLNDVRREHTKTIVALRQAEHQVMREKEKSEEQLMLQKKEYDLKLEQLEKKNTNLEKERNMLVTTVRQEGLGLLRMPAKGHTSSTDDSDMNNDEKENKILSAGTSEVKQPTKQKHKKRDRIARSKNHLEPRNTNHRESDSKAIASALYDLKSLSEAILKMNDNDDDKDIV